MKVLVTGSRGLLGSAIRRMATGHDFTFDPPGDLRDPVFAAKLLEETRRVRHSLRRQGRRRQEEPRLPRGDVLR